MNKKKRSDVVFYSLIIGSVIIVLFIHWFFGLPKEAVTSLDVETFSVESSSTGKLNLMSYNIHYGKGVVSDNDFPVSKEVTYRNLNEVVELVKNNNINILAVQEVDFYASRSNYIDQVEYIATKAGFKYVVRALDWDVRYVPFPYWPPRNHYGRVKSGIAVFSKYPIKQSVRYIFEKPTDNTWYYNLFYLDRLTQAAVIDVDGTEVMLFNSHLEAFRKDAREQQAKRLINLISNTNSKNVILLGDLNAIPPESSQKINFKDHPDIDYSDNTVNMYREETKLRDIFTPEEYEDDLMSYHTFPSDNPNRKLDYIFVSDNFKIVDKGVVGGEASDHLAVYAELELV